MNLDEIKDIIQKEGGKIIIVENDNPQMVIMSFEEWKGKKRQAPPPPQTESTPKPAPRKTFAPMEERSEDLTIDDLPL